MKASYGSGLRQLPIFLSAAAGLLAAAGWTGAAAEPEPAALARVEVAGPLESYPLPGCAHLRDAAGAEYLLAVAPTQGLARTGWPFRVLDTGAPAEAYVLAAPRRTGAREAAAGRFAAVYDDGRNWVVRATAGEADSLAALGFAVRRLGAHPLARVSPAPAEARLAAAAAPRTALASMPDARVAELLASVRTNRLYALMRRLTGVEPTVAAGDLYTIATRRTTSGSPISKATQMACDHLQALGLDVRFQTWSYGGTSGRNVVATQAGGSRAGEVVVVVAHLDDQPSGSTAPGADDNASGSAAVITAAEMFRQYRFARTVRFLLVTGEEQGLYGSEAYAAAAQSSGEVITAVYNMDMIAWDSDGDGALDLHIRQASDPGSTADRALATVFTSVVTSYGLSAVLRPEIVADGEPYSDHASFWDYGYPAVLAIEDYDDFNDPHYHTTGDTLATLNWPYYCRFVQASLATVAHLAEPEGRAAADALEVCAQPAAAGTGVGASAWSARHESGATEAGADGRDLAWSAVAANPNTRWLKLQTSPYGTALAADARPADGETLFRATLVAVDSSGSGVSGANRLRFDLLTPPASNRIYLARVHVDGARTAGLTDFDWVGDLRDVVAAGGFLDLPALQAVANGVAYGTCDVAARFVDTSRAGCSLSALAPGRAQIILRTRAQLGTRVRDAVETGAGAAPGAPWSRAAAFTNAVPPDLGHFESGWTELQRTLDASALPAARSRHFRVKRTWLAPP